MLSAVTTELFCNHRHALSHGIITPIVFVVTTHPVCKYLSRLLTRIVAVRVTGHKPVIFLVHVQHVRILTVLGQIILVNQERMQTTFLYFTEHRHVSGSKVEMSVYNAGFMFASASTTRGTFKSKNFLAVDTFQDTPNIIEHSKEFSYNRVLQKSKAHNMLFRNNHKISVEECSCSRNYIEILGFIHDVFRINCFPIVNPTKKTL